MVAQGLELETSCSQKHSATTTTDADYMKFHLDLLIISPLTKPVTKPVIYDISLIQLN
jgi:hypothetical protein